MQTRWAWGNEEPCELERSVAPRVRPDWCILRTLLLCFLSWLVLTALVLAVFFVPVSLGRGALHLVQTPRWLFHDPVCFFIGFVITCMAVSVVARCNFRALNRYFRSIMKMPSSVYFPGWNLSSRPI